MIICCLFIGECRRDKEEYKDGIRTHQDDVKGWPAQLLQQPPCDHPGGVHEALERIQLFQTDLDRRMTCLPLTSSSLTPTNRKQSRASVGRCMMGSFSFYTA